MKTKMMAKKLLLQWNLEQVVLYNKEQCRILGFCEYISHSALNV
jgi:hypothetical protein